MGRIDVDLESLPEVSSLLGTYGGEMGGIALELTPVAAKVGALFAQDMWGSGGRATLMLGHAITRAGVLSTGAYGMSASVNTVYRNYVAAEEYAQRIMATGAGVQTLFSIGSNKARVGLAQSGVAAYSTLPLWARDAFGRHLAGAPLQKNIAATLLLSPLGAKAVLGYKTYMDAKAQVPGIVRRHLLPIFKTISKEYVPFRDEITAYSADVLNRSGMLRSLNHTVQAPEEIRQQAQAELRVPLVAADYAYNLGITGQTDHRLDEHFANQGTVVEYAGVVVQKVMTENGQEKFIVYIPGSDSTSAVNGDPLSWFENLSQVTADPNTSIEESSAAMQLVYKALEEAGAGAQAETMMVGFSQGGAVAFNFAQNKLTSQVYKLDHVYTQGSPTSGLATHGKPLKHTQVEDKNDFVPDAAGTRQQSGVESQRIETDFVQASGQDPAMVHGEEEYRVGLEANPQGKMQPEFSKDLDPNFSQVSVTAGSTQPQNMTAEQLEAYKVGSYATAGYLVAEDLGDLAAKVAPHPVAKAVLGAPPEIFTGKSGYGDYYDAATYINGRFQEVSEIPGLSEQAKNVWQNLPQDSQKVQEALNGNSGGLQYHPPKPVFQTAFDGLAQDSSSTGFDHFKEPEESEQGAKGYSYFAPQFVPEDYPLLPSQEQGPIVVPQPIDIPAADGAVGGEQHLGEENMGEQARTNGAYAYYPPQFGYLAETTGAGGSF